MATQLFVPLVTQCNGGGKIPPSPEGGADRERVRLGGSVHGLVGMTRTLSAHENKRCRISSSRERSEKLSSSLQVCALYDSRTPPLTA